MSTGIWVKQIRLEERLGHGLWVSQIMIKYHPLHANIRVNLYSRNKGVSSRNIGNIVVMGDRQMDHLRIRITHILGDLWRPCAENDYCRLVLESRQDAKELIEECLIDVVPIDQLVRVYIRRLTVDH